MDRRAFAQSLLAAGYGAAASAERPNVVVFITDDESWLERSSYGWSSVPTPHFERVAREGVLFTNAFTSAPSCAPSRAALLTGRNFWELEQGAFIQAWLPQKFPVLPDLMEAAGYAAGFTGKGWGPGVLAPSGRKRNPAGTAYNSIKRKAREADINDIDYAANFQDFLEKRPKDKPFSFWVGPTEPHGPYAADNYTKLDRFGIKPDAIRVPPYLPDTPDSRRDRGNFIYEIGHVDRDLGRIIRILEDTRQLDNTLLIVTADNGTAIPRSKTNLYDWGLRIPLAIRWPKRIKAGRRVDDFVNFIDFAPTILQAAGIPTPQSMTGRSFLDVLSSGKSGRVDKSRSWTAGGIEWHGELDPVNFAARMIRGERYKYIVNYGNRPDDHPDASKRTKNRPREELYDCRQDPWELDNLADAPQHASTLKRLREQLEAYQKRTGDPRVTGDMAVFDKTRQFVQGRKRINYRDATDNKS